MKIVLKLNKNEYEISKSVPKDFLENLEFPYTKAIWKINDREIYIFIPFFQEKERIVKKFINFLKYLKNISIFLNFLENKCKIENCIELPKISLYAYANLDDKNVCFNALYSFEKAKKLLNFFFSEISAIKEYYSDIEMEEKVDFSKIFKNEKKKVKIYLTEILIYQEILFEIYKYLFKLKKCEGEIEFFCTYHSFKDIFEFSKNYKGFEEELQKSLIYLINILRKIYERAIRNLLYLRKEKVKIDVSEKIPYLIDVWNILELKYFWEKDKIEKFDEKIKDLINLELLDFRFWMMEILTHEEIDEFIPFHLSIIDDILLYCYKFGKFEKALENEIRIIKNKIEGLNEIFDYFLKLKIFNLNG
jgi:hypothetical protein